MSKKIIQGVIMPGISHAGGWESELMSLVRGRTGFSQLRPGTLNVLVKEPRPEIQKDFEIKIAENPIPGNKAVFTVDAFPKRTFEGVVSQVRQSPQTVQNVVTYDVVINVDNSDLALKPGMTAATRTIIDERNNVVRVPNQALRYSPGGSPVANNSSRGGNATQAQVWVLRDEEPVAISVVVGLDDDNFTEIVKGELKPDDRVIIAKQRDAAQTTVPQPRL
jgi:multidrug efflux pump subunit AcrA (membrane-fusion protein)